MTPDRAPADATPTTTVPDHLRDLVDVPLCNAAEATRAMDGRLVPLVFVTVLTAAGTPRGGVLVDLLDEHGRVADETRTSAGGLAVLRFPSRAGCAPADPSHDTKGAGHGHGRGDPLPAVTGTVRVSDGSPDGSTTDVAVREGESHVVARIVAPEPDGDVPVMRADDQLSRLPADFSPQTCAELSARAGGLFGTPTDALPHEAVVMATTPGLSLIGRRTPLVRRLDVVRAAGGKRWLVQLRQEWVLLGYTLGELSDVTALDPGATLKRTDQTAERVGTTVRDTADRATATLTETLTDTLRDLGTIDTVVTAAASASGAAAGGLFGVPGMFVGAAAAGLSANATVSTEVDTTLLVNRVLQQVSTLVNEAIGSARSVAEDVQHTVTDVLEHTAPLVSRVTNALHWRVYENYAVCTHVEGVLEIEAFELGLEGFRFTASWARAFRSYLEPALLDRTLAARFSDVADATPQHPGYGQATVELEYVATVSPGVATVRLGDALASFPLDPNTRVVRRTLPFLAPVMPGATVTGDVTVTAGAQVRTEDTPIDAPAPELGVTKLSVWVHNPLTGAPDQKFHNPGDYTTLSVTMPGTPAPVRGPDPLVEHLNANWSYYVDVIAAAAVRFPALRVDAGRNGGPLAGITPEVWRLPIVGFEGNTMLVARPVTLDTGLRGTEEPRLPAAVEQLRGDSGSGTLVQLRAPGSYGEVLQGVAVLTDLASSLHPALRAPAVPVVAEFPVPAPVDGKRVPAADGVLTDPRV